MQINPSEVTKILKEQIKKFGGKAEVSEVGQVLSVGDEAGVVESVKAASDVYSPVSGEVIEINPLLEDDPEMINTQPYEDGWFYKLQPSDSVELDDLMNSDSYCEFINSED